MKSLWLTLVLVLVQVQDLVCEEPLPDNCSSTAVRLRTFRIVTSPCNFTTLGGAQREAVEAWPLVVALPLVQVVVLGAGLPLNLLSLCVLLRSEPVPSSALMATLTACDLLLLLALPFRAAYHWAGHHWALGEAACRLVVALFYGNMYGSVLSLACVAVDRYVALVHPFGAKVLRTRRAAVGVALGVWAAVGGAMLPLLLTQQTFELDEPRITTCHDALPQRERDALLRPYFLSLLALCFAPSLLAALFCHASILYALRGRGRRYGRALRATALVLLVFLVTFVPSHVLLLRAIMDDGAGESDRYSPYLLSLALSSANAVLDPLIYYYSSAPFRDKARLLLRSALCWWRHQTAAEQRAPEPPSSGRQSQQTHSSKVTLLSPANHSSEPATANHSSEPATANHSSEPAEPANHSPEPATANHSPEPATANHSPEPATANHSSEPATANHSPEPAEPANHSSEPATANHSSEPATANHSSEPATANHSSEPATANHSSEPSAGLMHDQTLRL